MKQQLVQQQILNYKQILIQKRQLAAADTALNTRVDNETAARTAADIKLY
jgi:hypothetical protein